MSMNEHRRREFYARMESTGWLDIMDEIERTPYDARYAKTGQDRHYLIRALNWKIAQRLGYTLRDHQGWLAGTYKRGYDVFYPGAPDRQPHDNRFENTTHYYAPFLGTMRSFYSDRNKEGGVQHWAAPEFAEDMNSAIWLMAAIPDASLVYQGGAWHVSALSHRSGQWHSTAFSASTPELAICGAVLHTLDVFPVDRPEPLCAAGAIRRAENGEWWFMNRREQGWSSMGYRYGSLTEIVRNWAVRPTVRLTDEHGPYWAFEVVSND